MALLTPQDRIYVAGHRGLMGSAITRNLQSRGYQNIIQRTHAELELTQQNEVVRFFEKERPTVVFLAAARVGGIWANNVLRAQFIYDNLMIQNNVLWSAYQAGVHRVVFIGSSCIYPKHAPQPMPEDCLLAGPLEPTNQPYAIAKIAGLELVNSLRRQYNCDYFSVMPTNLYGIGDNYHPEHSHVLPGLVRRFHEAKVSKQESVSIWGTGTPKREFLYADDAGDAIVHLAENLSFDELNQSKLGEKNLSHINIGSGDEVTISDLAHAIAAVTGFQGRIEHDLSKPDGTPRKLLDSSFLASKGWRAQTHLQQGLARVYQDFLSKLS